MKYFKVFNTENEYLEYIHSEECITPYVITLRDSSNTWISAEIHDYSKDYFTIESLEDNNVISLKRSSGNANQLILAVSTDDGDTWQNVTIPSDNTDTELITLNSGGRALVKNVSGKLSENQTAQTYFNSSENFNIEGNIMSITRGDDFQNITSTTMYEFSHLFEDCTTLVSASNLILEAQSIGGSGYQSMFNDCTSLTGAPQIYATSATTSSTQHMFSGCTSLVTPPSLNITSLNGHTNLAYMFAGCTSLTTVPSLPATTMRGACYAYMFQGCTSLTTVPSDYLSAATTMTNGCYNGMFKGCTSLTTVPELPATTLNKQCYESMFAGCTSLTAAPSLPATTMGSSAYAYMFSGCTSLTTVQEELPATTLASSCYRGMFDTCTSLTTTPELPATTLASECYRAMFANCSSLISTPSELPATTLAASAYTFMFTGCISLTETPELSATTLADSCYRGMFDTCTSLTAAPELPATTLANNCYNSMFANCSNLTTAPFSIGDSTTTIPASACTYMFDNCTSLTIAPSLPATTLADNCYQSMFHNCTSLTTAPELPARTLANNCYNSMFRDCSSLTLTPSKLPATTLADSCYRGMFYTCTSLTTASELPATTLANNCYNSMFRDCSSLTLTPSKLPATTLANNCYRDMFNYCTSLTTAPELPATTLASECYRAMFANCTKLNYIKCLATDISADNCTTEWTRYVAPSGTFVKKYGMNDWSTGASGIPNGWTVEEYSDVHVTGVTISPTAETITKGNTVTLTATVSPNDAYDKSVTWTTSDSSVATVANGVVTGVGCGNAIITVTTHDGSYTAQCTTTVENPVTGVTLDSNVTYILTGETYQLVATVSPSDACSDKSVTWSTSDPSIATVSNNGLVTAVATGSAVVTVTTTVGSYTASCAVEVSEPVAVTSVTLDESTLDITVGQTRQLTATVLPNNATDKSVTWSSSNNNIATVTSNGLVTAVATGSATVTVTTTDGGFTAQCAVTITDPGFTSMAIEGASVVSAETCQYRAICDNTEDVTSSATWSITAGSQYATINSSNGEITILNGASESSVTIQAVYAGLTATTTVTLTYVSGAVSETTSVITTDVGGNSTSIVTTITTYADNSSTEVVETIVTDVNGDSVGSSESTKATNADGSYNSVTTNYDENGDPTNGSNVTGDTDGNVSTQTVEYDESGNTVVTGYDIDTRGSESGKTFNHDGVNTDYYAFDVTHGFVLDFDFTIDFSNQPPNQHQSHHNILNAKRADPSPYYGFQLRHTGTNKNIQLGTQFETGSNDNTDISPTSSTGNVGTYNLRIVYDPNSTGNTFTCINTATQDTIFLSDLLFPDIEELKNLKVTIGYAVNASGNPFRYSNITVQNFELKKLKNVANPTITCEDNEVSISCSTVGASVYYRLNLHGDYSAYTTPITITADTVVQAYATYSGDTSDIIRADCSYELEEPVISCDGEFVTITCPHVGTTIYYRLDESGSYSAYTTPIEITADTIVEAYSELSGYTSSTIKETCIYIEGVDEPVITYSENIVSISCDTVGAEIYYRLNESGSYSAYTEPFEITATTIVESYTTLGAKTSETVNETCTYNPLISHRWHAADISDEYVCSGGNKYYKEYYQVTYDGGETWTDVTPEETRTGSLYEELSWDCNDFSSMYFTIHSLEDNNVIHIRRSGPTNNVENYSLDGGKTWSAMTSGSGDKTITTLNNGDTMWIKCTTNKWTTDYNKNNALYSTKNIKVYGNIMSLLYGDNFTGQTTVGEFGLCGIFFGTSATGTSNTKIVSAKNLVLPATSLAKSSYNGLFRGCSNLVDSPRLLPATTLYQDTYSSMFEGCTSLVEGPVICATTLNGTTSMGRMFCMARSGKVTAAMTKAPVLPATTLGNSSYKELFKGNGSLNEITLYATTLGSSSLQDWVANTGNGSGTFYKDPNLTLSTGNSGIPSGWTVVPLS